MDARCHAVVMTVENQKETKKKSVTAGLYEDPDRLVVVKKRGCDWGACGRPRRRDLATSLALRVRPRRGRTRTRARPSRLRAIAGRKPRDETRSSGGEIAEKRLSGAECAGIGMLPAERSSMKVYVFITTNIPSPRGQSVQQRGFQ